MPFTQKNRKNSTICHGCRNNCEIVVHPVKKLPYGETVYTLEIAGQNIPDYQDTDGSIQRFECVTNDVKYALKQACKIAKLCDYYHHQTQIREI